MKEPKERTLQQQVVDQFRESFAEAVKNRLQSDYHGPFGSSCEAFAILKSANPTPHPAEQP